MEWSVISHAVLSFFIRLSCLVLFAELLTSTFFIAKGLCSLLLFLSMYKPSLSTKTKLYNWSFGIQDKCFFFLACVLPSMPPTLRKKKKKESVTVFSLDSLVSGVLFQLEIQI